MAIEKSWRAISPRAFTSDGTSEGVITLASTKNFKVKQIVNITATALISLKLQVKSVISTTQLAVGPINEPLHARTNLTLYTVAASSNIFAERQPRPDIPEKEYNRAVYEEEPTVAKRVINVDELGELFTKENPQPTLTEFIRNGAPQIVTEDTVDPSNNRPLPVKITGLQGDVVIEPENLNLQTQNEGEYHSVDNPKPDSTGLVSHERGVTQDRTKQTQRITAKRGTVDTDTVSQDVSIHDNNGNGITSQTNGSQRAMDVGVNVGGAQIDPRMPSPGTLTDRSGTATGTSAEFAAANAIRKYFFIQNVSTGIIWINFGIAAVVGKPSIEIGPGEKWEMKDGFISTEALHIIAQSGTRDFTAKEG